MNAHERRQSLARRHAPVLVLWPEIPPDAAATAALRATYSRPAGRWASRPTGGAHVTRDFHPCDVRQILRHAQAWEPVSPLPLVPRWFSRVYRDTARFCFWPIAVMVIVSLLALAFAQGLPAAARQPTEAGILLALGMLYLATLRSPILVPLDAWHHLNHAVLGVGVVVAWGAVFGTDRLWFLGPIIVIPTILSFLTGLAMRAGAGLTHSVLALLQHARDLVLRLVAGTTRTRAAEPHTSLLFHGLKAAHEYTGDAELFYRDPHTREPIHRADAGAHWAAYARIRAADRGGPLCYARVLDPDDDGVQIVQYWFCYFYNDWAIPHEGDWESAIVFLRDGRPVAVAASQHGHGEYRDCGHVEWQGARPVLHVAAGSHANYFEAGAHVAERPVAGLQLSALDAAVLGRDVLDFVDFAAGGADPSVVLDALDVVLIPDPDPVTGRWGHAPHDPACRGGCRWDFEWLDFAGHWGAAAVGLRLETSGPRGPAFSGFRWDDPRIWATTMCRGCRACEARAQPHRLAATGHAPVPDRHRA